MKTKPAVKKPTTTRSAISTSARDVGPQRLECPQHIEFTIRTPDLDAIITHAVRTIASATSLDRQLAGNDAERHHELEERRLKLAEDDHEMRREEFAFRVREFEAREAEVAERREEQKRERAERLRNPLQGSGRSAATRRLRSTAARSVAGGRAAVDDHSRSGADGE